MAKIGGDIRPKIKKHVSLIEPLVPEKKVVPLEVPVAIKSRQLNYSFDMKAEKKDASKRYGWFIFVMILLLASGIFYVIQYFGIMEIHMTPITLKKNIKETITLAHNTSGNISESIPYEITKVTEMYDLEKIPKENIQATEHKIGTIQGTVRIFNTNMTSVNIPMNTKIKAISINKIFTTKNPAKIPPAKKDQNKIIPGFLDLEISSVDILDPSILPQDFAFLDLSPTIKNLYGRSIGGFTFTKEVSGNTSFITSEQDAYIKKDLFSLASLQLPAGYHLFPDAVLYTIIPQQNFSKTVSETKPLHNSVEASVTALIIKESDLEKYLLSTLSKNDQILANKKPNDLLIVTNKVLSLKGDVETLSQLVDHSMNLEGEFTVEVKEPSGLLCKELYELSFADLESLTTDHTLLRGRMSEVSIIKRPPWLIKKPTKARFRCIEKN